MSHALFKRGIYTYVGGLTKLIALIRTITIYLPELRNDLACLYYLQITTADICHMVYTSAITSLIRLAFSVIQLTSSLSNFSARQWGPNPLKGVFNHLINEPQTMEHDILRVLGYSGHSR